MGAGELSRKIYAQATSLSGIFLNYFTSKCCLFAKERRYFFYCKRERTENDMKIAQLQAATKAITSKPSISPAKFVKINVRAGTGVARLDGQDYVAVQAGTKGRWFLTGEFA